MPLPCLPLHRCHRAVSISSSITAIAAISSSSSGSNANENESIKPRGRCTAHWSALAFTDGTVRSCRYAIDGWHLLLDRSTLFARCIEKRVVSSTAAMTGREHCLGELCRQHQQHRWPSAMAIEKQERDREAPSWCVCSSTRNDHRWGSKHRNSPRVHLASLPAFSLLPGPSGGHLRLCHCPSHHWACTCWASATAAASARTFAAGFLAAQTDSSVG